MYARKFEHVLTSGDARELLSLSDSMRQNVMKSLVLLAKYRGCYGRWKEIKEAYQLKWSSSDEGLQVFNEIYGGKNNYKIMIEWLSDVCKKIPDNHAKILYFCTLTGLRADEAFQSIRLVQNDLTKYLNKDRLTLEHFQYPDLFIRRTKKAYISLMTEDILQLAREAPDCGYNAFRMLLRRNDLDMHMKYCRKIFSTYLRTKGIESELIDLLTGRRPKSVFARHYFRPDFDRGMKRIRKHLDRLQVQITAIER